MTSGAVGFFLLAVIVPILVGEARDLAPFLAAWLLRWGARRVGHAGQACRYEEEWLADLERVPGKATKLAHACGVLILSVPRLRAQLRRRSRGMLLPGWVAGKMAKKLTSASEADAVLQRAAEMFVPRFADHCFIDLFQGGTLVRQAQRHAGNWTPPPGTWAQSGQPICYPEGHFCQRAMERLDTVLATDLAQTGDSWSPPSAESMAVARQVGLESVLAAPLYADGRLLGVISLATSSLTSRTGRFGPGDRDLMGTVANQVSAAIDATTTARTAGTGRTRVRPKPESRDSWSSLSAYQA